MMYEPREHKLFIRSRFARRGIYWLPNLFTIAALFAGFYAIVQAMGGRYEQAAIAIFVAFFMWWQGRFSIVRILPVAVLVPIALFFMFEVWFLVPLPKGPIEEWLGF